MYSTALTSSLRQIATIAVCASIGFVTPALAKDRSPLSQIERLRVIEAGIESAGANHVIAKKINRDGRRRSLLLVERRPGEKGQSKRRANVFIYDYDVDKLIHLVVNASSGKVVHRSALTQVQLPLIDEEIQWATNLVFTDVNTRARLEAEFLRTTGKDLQDISEIHFKAFSFTADPVEKTGDTTERARKIARCGRSRCTQILMYTADKVVLDVSPIVDLSKDIVLAVSSDGLGLDGEVRN